ncbi:hypothetical protein [Streptococcus sp. NLN76]|uniref:hypothetical protein n=1 Tax=Streptococcus sp. NLN76 TaxID=2822800 RepID=UPI0018AAD35D|nr:hypothetical protein [Streptococcus sp. NLN76]MBF8969936.1 hypothetical protein [Streptococcus sp. NLN76]
MTDIESTYSQKRIDYKNLGLIIFSLLTLLSLSACSIIIEQISNLASSESSSTQEGSSDNEGKLQASSKKKKEVYKAGDKITFDNIAEFTITKLSGQKKVINTKATNLKGSQSTL